MGEFHEDGHISKIYSKIIYNKRGINVDVKTGQIEYNGNEKMKVNCKSLYLSP